MFFLYFFYVAMCVKTKLDKNGGRLLLCDLHLKPRVRDHGFYFGTTTDSYSING